MKIFPYILSSVILLLIGLIILLLLQTNDEVYTTTICVYDKTFIEFNDNGKVWGTMLLDDNGNPVSCDERVTAEKTNEQSVIKEEIYNNYI